MASFSWKRLRRSTGDVFGPAEKGRSLVIRVLAWLALLGIPVLAIVNAETMMPPTVAGRVLWAAVVLAALVLGIQAAYRHRSALEAPPMAPADYEAMIQMRQLAGSAVGMFGIYDGRFDPGGLAGAARELNAYRWTLRHHGKLAFAIGRYADALEKVVAEAQGMPDFKGFDEAEKLLHEVCREYEARRLLAGR
jgi:hypothetical protein